MHARYTGEFTNNDINRLTIKKHKLFLHLFLNQSRLDLKLVGYIFNNMRVYTAPLKIIEVCISHLLYSHLEDLIKQYLLKQFNYICFVND